MLSVGIGSPVCGAEGGLQLVRVLRDARTEPARALVLGPWSLVPGPRNAMPAAGLRPDLWPSPHPSAFRAARSCRPAADAAPSTRSSNDRSNARITRSVLRRKHALHADGGRSVRMDEFTRQSYRDTRSGNPTGMTVDTGSAAIYGFPPARPHARLGFIPPLPTPSRCEDRRPACPTVFSHQC